MNNCNGTVIAGAPATMLGGPVQDRPSAAVVIEFE